MSSQGELRVFLGGDGIPFLTRKDSVPNYKNGAVRQLQPQLIRKARVEILDLSDEKQYLFYSKIWDAVGLGVATVIEEDRHWVESKENWKVFVRWYINSKMDPAELRDLRLENVQRMANSDHVKKET